MTNIEKALALINTFATGDTEKATSLLAEGYIQHNLAYGTGRDAFVGSVAWLASAPVKTTVQNIRAFEDGDKVFLQTVYNFAGAGEQVALISSVSMPTAGSRSTGTIWPPKLIPIPPATPRSTVRLKRKTLIRKRPAESLQALWATCFAGKTRIS